MPTRLPSGRWRPRVRHPRTGKQLSTRDVIGGPVDTDSMREVARRLSIAVARERTPAFLSDTVQRAGVELSPGASWALLRLGAPDAPSIEKLTARPHVQRERLLAAVEELRGLGLLEGERPTEAGRATRGRLVAAH